VKNTARFAKDKTAFASAWMVCITARTAGKLATSHWRNTAVAIDPKRICLVIDADARLAAAAGGAARYFADSAGLEGHAISQFQTATIAACREAFEHLTSQDPHLEITLTHFSDRIEVALAHLGDAKPAVGLDTIAGFAKDMTTGGAGQNIFAGVDRVQYETHGAQVVTRLTKYTTQGPPEVEGD
jgi:hypothetical protein